MSTQLQNKAAADFLRDQNSFQEADVSRRTTVVIAIHTTFEDIAQRYADADTGGDSGGGTGHGVAAAPV